MPPLHFCACRVTYIIEPPRKYKGYAGLWTRCIECRGWIEVADDGSKRAWPGAGLLGIGPTHHLP